MSGLLEGKTAVITGANRGIGRAILERFCEQGAAVFACARKQTEELEALTCQLSQKYGQAVRPIYFDLEKEEQIKAGVAEIWQAKKEIDILVNNAGILSVNKTFAMTPMEDLKHIFEVNFFAQMYLTQLLVRRMQRSGKGSIIYISSVSGIDGFFSGYDYGASKAALNFAVVQQSKELGRSNIRVNAIAPGIVLTDMVGGENAEKLNSLLPSVNLERFAKPEEIAGAVVFLASELSSYVTGQVIRVDGGLTPPKARW